MNVKTMKQEVPKEVKERAYQSFSQMYKKITKRKRKEIINSRFNSGCHYTDEYNGIKQFLFYKARGKVK